MTPDPVAITASGDASQQVESHSPSALNLAEPRREFGPHSVRGRDGPDTGDAEWEQGHWSLEGAGVAAWAVLTSTCWVFCLGSALPGPY